MKIILSAYACAPNAGSEMGNGWNWAVALAERGHEVWCLTTPRAQAEIERESPKLGLDNLHFVFVTVPGWVQRAYRWQVGVYWHYLVWQRKAYLRARALDREVDVDLVHHVTLGSLQMSSHLWRLEKPFFLGPMGGGQNAPAAFKRYFYGAWKSEVQRTIVGRILMRRKSTQEAIRRASLVLATNAETEAAARRVGAHRVERFLDTSLPESFFPESIPVRADEPLLKLLWVGRLFARKGLPLVLDGLAQVSPECDFRLSIYGDGPMRGHVPTWIREKGLDDKVNWLGQVPWESVKSAYAESDVFVFCSLRDSSPAQLLEAMAYGLPIITLDIHGSSSLVPDNAGIKVPVTTPEETVGAIARAVERLRADPELRRSMGAAGHAFARTQTWPLKVDRMEQLYRGEVRLPTVAETAVQV